LASQGADELVREVATEVVLHVRERQAQQRREYRLRRFALRTWHWQLRRRLQVRRAP